MIVKKNKLKNINSFTRFYIKVTIIVFFYFMTSCSKKESNVTNSIFEVPIIAGYKLIDIYGLPSGVVGTPNIKTEAIIEGIAYGLGVYPIPTDRIIGFALKAPNHGKPRQIWIKAARSDGSFRDEYNFGIINMSANANVFDTVITENQLNIDMSRFTKGYYRLYVSVADQILYENIVVTK